MVGVHLDDGSALGWWECTWMVGVHLDGGSALGWWECTWIALLGNEYRQLVLQIKPFMTKTNNTIITSERFTKSTLLVFINGFTSTIHFEWCN